MHKETILYLATIAISLLNISLVEAVRIENGGYTDIRVAIHDSISENEDIIESIRMMFSNASELLFKALKIYFREVTIIVPKNWTLNGTSVYGGHHFSTAEIRIDKPNPLYENTPYTQHSGLCGESGRYIHLTPEFLAKKRNVSARFIVHEWARLRYGVFKEYGSQEDPSHSILYMEKKKVVPNACVGGISGYIWTINGKACKLNKGVVPQSDCHYVPTMQNENQKASLMSYFQVPSVEYFCTNDSSDPKLLHNRKAPNEQNQKCNYRSTMDVITSHQDFGKLSHQTSKQRTKFIFKKILDENARIVLVLDVSHRMSIEYRLDYLKEFATRFLVNFVPIDSFIGIVAFNDTAKNLTNGLLQITEESLRDELIAVVNNLKPSGESNLEEGLKKGLQMLREEPGISTAEGGFILLLSNGNESSGNLQKTFSDFNESGVIVNIIVLGAEENTTNLETIADMTGGVSEFFDTRDSNNASNATTEVERAVLSSVMAQTNMDSQRIFILSENLWLNTHEENLPFTVDANISMKTTGLITSKDVTNISISFTDPDGNEMKNGSDSDLEIHIKNSKSLIIRMPRAKPGQWIMSLKSLVSAPVNLNVDLLSDALDPSLNQPIRATSWVSSRNLGPDGIKKMRIFAEVRKGYDPVVRATVIASVKTPNNQIVKITLKDDGTGADATKNDAIYSEYFTTFPAKGRYYVLVRVKDDYKARIKLNHQSPSFSSLDMDNIDTKELEKLEAKVSFNLSDFDLQRDDKLRKDTAARTKVTGLFQRVAFGASSFKVVQKALQVAKQIPPNKVTDLRVVATSKINDTLIAQLEWTYPGDDMQTGSVSWVELRGDSDWDQLYANFTQVHQFKNIAELEKPVPGGSLRVVNVKFQEDLVRDQLQDEIIIFYFALQAHDKDNYASEVSNIAAAYFHPVWNETINGHNQTKTQDRETSLPWNIVMWICVALVALVAVVIVIGVVGTHIKKMVHLTGKTIPTSM